jgi:nitrogen fixation protein FixH
MAAPALSSRDRWIPWYFVAFFVVLSCVDGVFVYLATSTNPGVVASQAYREGKEYNAVIAQADRQDALGWRAELTQTEGQLVFHLHDRDGAPLRRAVVNARLRRPVEAGHDTQLSLLPRGDGSYAAPWDAPMPGQWNISIQAVWNNQPFQYHRRLMVQP